MRTTLNVTDVQLWRDVRAEAIHAGVDTGRLVEGVLRRWLVTERRVVRRARRNRKET